MRKDYLSNLRLVTEDLLKNLYNSSDSVKQADIDQIIKVAPQIVQQRQKEKQYSGKNPSKSDYQLEMSYKKPLSVKSTLKISHEKQKRILDLSAEIQEKNSRVASSLVFMAKPFVQTTLPHRDPGNVPEWYRRNGKLTLSVRPGWGDDPVTGERKCLGIPYGTIPRLLLIFMSSHTVTTRSRFIDLGNTLSEFMRKIGLDPKGKGVNSPTVRLKNHLLKLLRSTISFDYKNVIDGKCVNSFMDMNLVKEGSLEWYADNAGIPYPKSNREDFDGSWIHLSESFFECLISSSVPLDERVLNEIKQSPLALDLYAWMTHRTYGIGVAPIETSSQKPSFITWDQLQNQFGASYGDIKDFKRKVKPILRKIQALSYNLSLEEGRGGLKISQRLTRIK